MMLNNITDPYHIERERFKKHENEYENLLSELLSVQNYPIQFSIEKIEFFLEILITIKRRNPSIRKTFKTDFNARITSPEFAKEWNSIIELSITIDKAGTKKFLSTDYKEKLNNDENLNDRFRCLFLNDNGVTKMVIESLMKNKFYIAFCKGENEFITSDNPGFCVVDGSVQNFGGFDFEYIFCFP